MKTLTRNEALAGAMTAEEAGTATLMRALQIQGAAVALLTRGGSQLSDWENTLKVWEQNRPWDLLPEESETPYGKWDLWTAATLRVNGDPLTRKRLVALLAGLHGETAKAETQIQAFEKAIEQPLNPKLGTKGGRPKGSKNPDPDKGLYGTNVGYLMGRLLQKDADIADKIGKGKQFRSINAAAQHHGLISKRKRYELNPEVNTNNAATRIVEVLGPAKAAELVTAITLQLTQSDD